jgi:hypothetical protein
MYTPKYWHIAKKNKKEIVINGVEKENSGSGTETFHLFPLLAPHDCTKGETAVRPRYFFWKEAARAALRVSLEGATFAYFD